MTIKSRQRILLLILFIFLILVIAITYYLIIQRVHVLSEYSSTGKLLGTNEYVIRKGDTIMHGKFVNYNEAGIKVSEGQFLDNEPNGICKYYYQNGTIEAVHYRKSSKVTLESYFYNENGLLEKYVLYDDNGKSAFIISFDEKGVIKYDGFPQIEIYQYKFANREKFSLEKEQYLKVGDKLKYSLIVANIPNSKRSFKVENISIDNTKVKRSFKKSSPCSN